MENLNVNEISENLMDSLDSTQKMPPTPRSWYSRFRP